MDDNPQQNTDTQSPSQDSLLTALTSLVDEGRFQTWWAEQQRERNRKEGYGETRNDPTYQQPPDTTSPSNILSCHRKLRYQSQNAPGEDPQPSAVFEFGHHFETIIERFLRSQMPPGYHVRNPVPVEFSVSLSDGDVMSITGSTDPVVFSERGDPVLLFECKSTNGLRYVTDSPRETHQAQAHAYSRGLADAHDLDSPVPIVYVYGSKTDLQLAIHTQEFDTEFWDTTVLPWLRDEYTAQHGSPLPNTVAEDKEYMCSYCSYADRCGNVDPGPTPVRVNQLLTDVVEDLGHDPQESSVLAEYESLTTVVGDTESFWDSHAVVNTKLAAEDEPVKGFLPCYEYPLNEVVAHLLTFPDVKLTPTVAAQYPELHSADDTDPSPAVERRFGAAPQRAVHDWRCPHCGTTAIYTDIDWSGSFTERPVCPHCSNLPHLRGPFPSEVYDHDTQSS